MAEAHGQHGEGPGPLSNMIAIVAFVLVIAIVIWGLLHIAGLSLSWFSSFAPRSSSAPATTATTSRTLPRPVVTATQPAPQEQAPAAPRYAGRADLAVRILSVTPAAGGLTTVEFDVANVGGSPSGSYSFIAYLPTEGGYVYASPVQYPLNPGDHIVNTLRFSQARGGTVTIVLHASDANQSNNTASQYIGGGYYPAYQYDYPQYQYSY